MSNLIDRICKHEGFEETPYPDPLTGGKPWTFGHGLTYITEAESRMVVKHRVFTISQELKSRIDFFWSLPEEVQDVLIEMAYQMGVKGLLNFKKMLNVLSKKDYSGAADEMLDSRWAKQTSGRANFLAYIVRSQKDE